MELADGPRGQAVAAGLLAREALLLDDEHPVAALGEPVAPRPRPTGPPPTTSTSHDRIVRSRSVLVALVISMARTDGIVARECPVACDSHERRPA